MSSAVAIGNFDGVHLGHQALIGQMVEVARAQALIPSVLTFDPHPTVVVAPDRVPPMISTIGERLDRLKGLGVDQVRILPFTKELAALSPCDFVVEVLVKQLQAKAIFVGRNFRFGYRKSGNCDTLEQLGEEFGFVSYFLDPVRYRGEVVSSTAIRKHLADGNVTRANRLLGHCFQISGPVVSGHGIGSKQTVPTLNLRPPEGGIVPRGVYVTETREPSTWAPLAIDHECRRPPHVLRKRTHGGNFSAESLRGAYAKRDRCRLSPFHQD
jgi:riboflavin kinase/FMN adenylyltransferase